MLSVRFTVFEDGVQVREPEHRYIDSSHTAAPSQFLTGYCDDEFTVTYPHEGNNLRITHCWYDYAAASGYPDDIAVSSPDTELCICPYGRNTTVNAPVSPITLVVEWTPATGA